MNKFKSMDRILEANKERDELLVVNSDLAPLEKLELLSKWRLWDVMPEHVCEFPEWKSEVIELARNQVFRAGSPCYAVSVIERYVLDTHNEGEVVLYIDVIRFINRKSPFGLVYRCGYATLFKTTGEVIDRIVKFCFDNKTIGFTV